MELKPLASNMTELQVRNRRILFSYKTPVAYQDLVSRKTFKTAQFWSVTTSRHINKWLAGELADVVPQHVIDTFAFQD